MKASTPILRLKGDEYYSRNFRLCRDGFKKHALPSWTGPLPKRIRLHLDSSSLGKWEWHDYHFFPLGTPSGQRLTTYPRADEWMTCVFRTKRVRFNATMEIIEP